MRSRTAWTRAALLLVPAVLLALIVACGGNDGGTTSSIASPAATAATPTGSAGSAVVSGAQADTMTIVATDNKFDKTSLSIKAGQEVAVTLENKGSAIHNLHLAGVKDRDGKDIATRLISGGQTDTIRFVIDKPGSYDYRCDVHPEMQGKLTVQ